MGILTAALTATVSLARLLKRTIENLALIEGNAWFACPKAWVISPAGTEFPRILLDCRGDLFTRWALRWQSRKT